MTEARVALQPAYVLHRRAYRDTSLLLEILSRDHGRVGVVARGARQPRARLRAVLQPFAPLLLSWSGRGDLATLTAAEPEGPARLLQGEALLGGFYLNELLLRLLGRWDPCPEVYGVYGSALAGLHLQGCDPIVLRRFERSLLDALGYGVHLESDAAGGPILPERRYRFEAGHGLAAAAEGAYAGVCLQAFQRGEPMAPDCLNQIRRLLQAALQSHLGPRPLKSRELLLRLRRRFTE